MTVIQFEKYIFVNIVHPLRNLKTLGEINSDSSFLHTHQS